jgi:diketogulonate reductase-like aldo/keto reductase
MHSRGVQIESWGPFAEGRNHLFTNPALSEIGAAHGKSVAQVVLRWLIQREVVVIPKSVRRDRMTENFDVFDFELTAEQTDRIAGLSTPVPRRSSTTGTRRASAGSAAAGTEKLDRRSFVLADTASTSPTSTYRSRRPYLST